MQATTVAAEICVIDLGQADLAEDAQSRRKLQILWKKIYYTPAAMNR